MTFWKVEAKGIFFTKWFVTNGIIKYKANSHATAFWLCNILNDKNKKETIKNILKVNSANRTGSITRLLNEIDQLSKKGTISK